MIVSHCKILHFPPQFKLIVIPEKGVGAKRGGFEREKGYFWSLKEGDKEIKKTNERFMNML